MKDSRNEPRRRHSAELKSQVLAECAVPNASVAGIARSHGLNANLVHKWRRKEQAHALGTPPASFIPVALPAPTVTPTPDIHMELRRGTMSMTITWPVAAAADCAAWMRELPR
jgi:transposase